MGEARRCRATAPDGREHETGPGAPARNPGDFVLAVRGTLPILLSAPHGGRQRPPGLVRREHGTVARDIGTAELARGVAREIERQAGLRPYLVAARFHRAYVEANRAEDDGAYGDADGAAYWRAYHGALHGFVGEIRNRWHGFGLLIDLHGQGAHPESIVRGTRNGRTVQALLARAGDAAQNGPKSLRGRLEAVGYAVRPASEDSEQSEPHAYDGGYIVATYGSHQSGGIDAIQIETGGAIRRDRNRRGEYARHLAGALVAFYEDFIAAGSERPAGG